jgi:UDP-GlcNAc:undecaprenyl-phosphate GlcNAc-1-phosphate transferase
MSVILIRLREGRSPFQADRSHFSHRLVERGLTPPWAVRTIYLVTLSGGLGALLLHRLDGWGAAVVALQTLCVLGVVAILEIKRPKPTPTRPSPETSATTLPADEATTG